MCQWYSTWSIKISACFSLSFQGINNFWQWGVKKSYQVSTFLNVLRLVSKFALKFFSSQQLKSNLEILILFPFSACTHLFFLMILFSFKIRIRRICRWSIYLLSSNLRRPSVWLHSFEMNNIASYSSDNVNINVYEPTLK